MSSNATCAGEFGMFASDTNSYEASWENGKSVSRDGTDSSEKLFAPWDHLTAYELGEMSLSGT